MIPARRRLLGLIVVAPVALMVAGSVAGEEPRVRVWETKDDHTTEGAVVLGAPPDAIYRTATDFTHWTSVFSDVSDVDVKTPGAHHGVVRFASRTFEHTITLSFDNTPDKAIHFRLTDGPPGASSHGEFVLVPVGDGTKTRVQGRLFLDVGGPAGWFVGGEKLRKMRQGKLQRDLGDLLKRFP